MSCALPEAENVHLVPGRTPICRLLLDRSRVAAAQHLEQHSGCVAPCPVIAVEMLWLTGTTSTAVADHFVPGQLLFAGMS